MQRTFTTTIIRVAFIWCAALALASCQGLNYGNQGQYDPYSDRDRYNRDDYYYDRERREAREERRRLERERERLERERERLNEERKKAKRRPQKKRDRCPSGWYPSEEKCTSKERRKGCKDMRTPRGLGCVTGR